MTFFKILSQGRINRITYITGMLLLTLLVVITSVIVVGRLPYRIFEYFPLILIPFYVLFGIYYNSLFVKRRHDINVEPEKGMPSPIYGGAFNFLYYLFWLGIAKGEPKDNQYGSSPQRGIDFITLVFGSKKRL